MKIFPGDFLLIFVLKKKSSDKEILERVCVYCSGGGYLLFTVPKVVKLIVPAEGKCKFRTAR